MEISLRAPEPSDVDFMYRLENEPDIRRVSLGDCVPISRQMLWDYVNNYSADIYRDRQIRLIIDCDGEPAGAIDITDFEPRDGRAIVGVAISKRFRGKGIAAKALDQAILLCKDALSMHQLVAIVPRDNEASLRLFESLGFKSSGCLKSWIKSKNGYVDAVISQLMLDSLN